MGKKLSVPRLRLKRKGEGGGLKHYARKYWYVFFLMGIFVMSLWFRTIPGRWNELIGLDEFHIYRIQAYALSHNLQIYNEQNLDPMRYTPLGVPTWDVEYPIPIYLPVLSWLFFSAMGLSMPFFEFDLFFPALLGAIGGIIAFFIAKELFKSNITGLFAAFFVSLTPALFTRTSAAAIDKEATAVIFMMATIWLFIKAYNKKGKAGWFYGILSGVSLGMLGLTWGGEQYIHLLVAAFIFLLFAANAILVGLDYLFSGFKKHLDSLENFMGPPLIKAYLPFIVIGILIPQFFPLHDDLTSISIVIPMAALAMLLIKYGAVRFGLVKKEKSHYIIPALLVIGAVIVVAGMIFLDYFDSLIGNLLVFLTLSKGVVGSTVAENAPGDWNTIISTLGTNFSSGVMPWASSFAWIFSVSLFMFLGMFVLVYEFYKTHNWLLIFPLVWVLTTMWSVFWFVRLLYILGPAAGVVAGFFVGWVVQKFQKTKYLSGKTLRSNLNYVTIPILIFMMLIVIVNAASTYAYAITMNTAICFPQYKNGDSSNPFNAIPCVTIDQNGTQVLQAGQPWYEAMNFLSQKTPEGSSILSWWDFGYWFQTRGNRPSVADGGNLGGKYLRNYELADWYTDKPENWSAWSAWMKKDNVSYIFMDYTLPGKYGAITTIASRGTKPVGMLEFQRNPQLIGDPSGNKTTVEYLAGQYAIWLTFNNNGTLIGPPLFLLTQNGKYYSKTTVNDVCTTNGIIHVGNDTSAMPGCVAISQIGVYYIPAEAEHTIFTDLMFMQGYGLPVEKVFDNTYVQIYKVNYEVSFG